MQDNKGWNTNLLKWASSFISGDASLKKKAEKNTVSISSVGYLIPLNVTADRAQQRKTKNQV
jgi:hypothetical protein